MTPSVPPTRVLGNSAVLGDPHFHDVAGRVQRHAHGKGVDAAIQIAGIDSSFSQRSLQQKPHRHARHKLTPRSTSTST